ncbi:MAG: hypothetical protein ACYC6N_22600 [Pirellulaceae bacterium]
MSQPVETKEDVQMGWPGRTRLAAFAAPFSAMFVGAWALVVMCTLYLYAGGDPYLYGRPTMYGEVRLAFLLWVYVGQSIGAIAWLWFGKWPKCPFHFLLASILVGMAVGVSLVIGEHVVYFGTCFPSTPPNSIGTALELGRLGAIPGAIIGVCGEAIVWFAIFVDYLAD